MIKDFKKNDKTVLSAKRLANAIKKISPYRHTYMHITNK